MLLKRDSSCLLLIDVQEKLAPSIMNTEALIDRCAWVVEVAQALSVPMFVSEQYPKGLGSTVPKLLSLVKDEPQIEKLAFSCMKDEDFCARLAHTEKTQIVLIGMETHVCVLQTALDLLAMDYQVFIVVDAVGSRFPIDYQYGLKRMKQQGAYLLTAEMVLFEWLETSGTAEFKMMSKRFLQNQG